LPYKSENPVPGPGEETTGQKQGLEGATLGLISSSSQAGAMGICKGNPKIEDPWFPEHILKALSFFLSFCLLSHGKLNCSRTFLGFWLQNLIKMTHRRRPGVN
jgi:hypothetical protein